MRPRALRCERLDGPEGVGNPAPLLSWRLAAAERGARQVAYRVTVDNLWDSGWRSGAEQEIEYGGAPLASSTRYVWTVEVRDAAGGESAASAAFGTGILHADEWRAAWIGRDAVNAPGVDVPADVDRTLRTTLLAPPLQLRRSFALERVPDSARVHVTARGLYRLHVNGVRVGDDELTPGWTDYRDRVQYQTYDVTDLLMAGENVLAAVVADGWWCGYIGFDARHQALHYGTEPQFLLQLMAGDDVLVVTDETWRERPGTIQYADLLMGEQVDARQETTGWTGPGYDDSFWPGAVVIDGDLSTLAPTLDAPVRATRTLPAATVVPRPEGHLVDFGQNLVGRVRLRVRDAVPGQRIAIRHGELLDDDGGLYTENLRSAEATDIYYAAGGPATFEPAFTTHGFRYALVSGYKPSLDDISATVLHSDTEFTGTFECDDDLVNRLQANIVWGQRGNFVSVPTDCPQRDERLGWTGDTHIFAPTAVFNADASAFYARWLLDAVSAQSAEGAFSDVVPLVTPALRRAGAPAWGDCGVLLPWLLYRHYGDSRTLARCFAPMKAWVDYIHRNNPSLLWTRRRGNDYGDWLQVDAQTPHEVVATAYFARSARTVALAAAALGHLGEAKVYDDLAARIAGAFRRAFVTPDGRVHGDTQTGYVMALGFGLLPPDLAEPAFRRLCTLIEDRGNRLTTGFLGVALLAPVLSEFGRPDLAHALLSQTEYPSWGYSIEQGATTIWERWDGWTKDRGAQSAAMNSFNHYSLGSIGEWLYRGVAGIDQSSDSVAWRSVVIRPRPGGRIRRASASYDSVLGEISSSWSLASGRFELDITIPPGATATVHIPTPDPSAALESGEPVASAAGVSDVEVAVDGLTCRVTSGRFRFSAPGRKMI